MAIDPICFWPFVAVFVIGYLSGLATCLVIKALHLIEDAIAKVKGE